jgi:hypothetical protein
VTVTDTPYQGNAAGAVLDHFDLKCFAITPITE